MRFVITSILVFGVAVLPAMAQDAAPPPAQATLPFPADAKYGYIDLQRVLAESTEGQAANGEVQALTDQKLAELEARNQELQGRIDSSNLQLQESQQKLAQGETVLSAEARLSLQREIQRLQLEVQRQGQDAQAEMERITQDAETEVGELQQQLQIDFELRLQPAIEAVATARGVDFLFSVGQGGLVWANPQLDLTADVVEELNASSEAAPE